MSATNGSTDESRTAQSANLEPWFGPHLQRNIYLSLLHLEPEEGSEKAVKVPESVVRAALLRRAVEDIHRIIQIRNGKQALSTLLQRGSVGDDLWQRFLRAEKEMEEELRDVVVEVCPPFTLVRLGPSVVNLAHHALCLQANALSPNWGHSIFQSANEIAANTLLREQLDTIQAKAAEEKEWWEKRKVVISEEFMKELDEPEKRQGNSDDGVLVDGNTPSATTGGSKKKKGKK